LALTTCATIIAYNAGDLRPAWATIFAVVDEIDSILIDEARTPLIISAPAQESENLYKTFATLASKLVRNEDYTVDEKARRRYNSPTRAITHAEQLLGHRQPIYRKRASNRCITSRLLCAHKRSFILIKSMWSAMGRS